MRARVRSARVGRLVQAAVPLAAALLAARAVWPAPANAVDLFPVDDWLGSGIKKAGDVVLGPLRLGVKEIAQLLAAIVGALADLLVPKSLVNAGLGGIKWLVQLPPVGTDATPEPGVPAVRMPHLQELRDTMTWIGITLLPLGIVITAGRAFLAPTADGDSPADVLGRALTAGLALLLYDWAWGVVTELSRLLTGGSAAMGGGRRRADARNARDRRRDWLGGRCRVRRSLDDHDRRHRPAGAVARPGWLGTRWLPRWCTSSAVSSSVFR